MFEFQYIELMNWAFWPSIKLPLDQKTIMITGPNGCGKTTFLDSIRTLLRVPRLSANRRFTDYLTGNVGTSVIKAVVANQPSADGQRAFEFAGLTSEFGTIAVIMIRKSGRWEKRFAVLDGDQPLHKLRSLRASDVLSPTSFTRVIKKAGCSESLLKVLALEQGQTDKLCEKSPRELLDLLLDVHGDKEIINRYQTARDNYRSAHLEFNQIGARLAEEQARLYVSQQKAEAFQRYRKLVDEIEHYESVLLPQSEYKSTKKSLLSAELAIKDLELRLRPLDREILNKRAALENADAELESRKRKLNKAREEKDGIEKEERELDIRLHHLLVERKQIHELLEKIEHETIEPIEPIRDAIRNSKKHLLRLEMQHEDVSGRLQQLQVDFRPVETGDRKIYPIYVSRFLSVLNEHNIPFRLLCDIIEITDSRWQLAVESILGRDRFNILVAIEYQLKARQLGEKHRYRGYIVTWNSKDNDRNLRTPAINSAYSYVIFNEPGIPDWIVNLLDRTVLIDNVEDAVALGNHITSVTRNGYRQDRRGGISISVDHFYCGSMGQTGQRRKLRQDIDDNQRKLAEIAEETIVRRQQLSELEKRLRVQEALRQGEAAAERKAEIDQRISELNRRHKLALDVRRQAELKMLDALDELNNFERDCEEQRQWLRNQSENQSETYNEIREFQDQIKAYNTRMAEIEEKLGQALVSEKALRDVPDIDELTPRYYAAGKLLEDYLEIPDETAVPIYENHKRQFAQQQKIYSDHQTGLRNWEKEFELAREKYVDVVDHTVHEYRKNVLALADRAGIEADVLLPNLKDCEDILETAQLKVRFGFDGKRPIDISASAHSGGQRVVASLILLMAMTTSGGTHRGGFFIIDEPFAHLSIERIDDVSRFLEKSRCQFILTSPTTHNVNVFTAARLQLNFRIKKPDQEFAPIPTVIRR